MARHQRLRRRPAVPDQATLASLVARLGHYLAHVDVERIVIAVTPGLAGSGCGHIVSDPGFDPDVAGRVAAISDRIRLTTISDRLPVPDVPADLLVLWDVRAKDNEPWRFVVGTDRSERCSLSTGSGAAPTEPRSATWPWSYPRTPVRSIALSESGFTNGRSTCWDLRLRTSSPHRAVGALGP